MSSKNELKIGSILSYAQMAAGIVIELFFTQAMIEALGKNEFGLYNTVVSTISMLSILSLGFNSSYVRYYSLYKAEDDTENISKLNGMFLLIFTVIGVVAFICGIFLSQNLKLVFDTGLSDSEYALAKILMILLTISLSLSFPLGVFGNIVSAHEKFIFLKSVSILRTVLGPMISMPLLLLGFRSVALVTVTLIVSILADSLNLYYVIVKLKQKFKFRYYEKGLFKDLLVYTSFIAINIIIDQVNGNVDNLMLARFKGTAEVAIYAVGSKLYTAYVRFSSAISGVFTPRIHRIVSTAENDLALEDELTALFIKVGRIQFYILALVSTGFLFFGQRFLSIWVGSGFEKSYYVAVLLMLSAMTPLIQNLGIEIQRAENRHHFRSIAYLIMAIFNVVCSYFLCQKYGAVGSTVGTAISYLLANGLIMNIYYHKRCFINIILFWKNILKIARGLIVPIILGMLLMRFVLIVSIESYLLLIIIYIVVFLGSIYFVSMNDYERGLVKSIVFKIKRSRKR